MGHADMVVSPGACGAAVPARAGQALRLLQPEHGAMRVAGDGAEGRVCVAVADLEALQSLSCTGPSDLAGLALPIALDDVAAALHLVHEHDGSPLEPDEVPLVRATRGEVITSAVFGVRWPGRAERFVRCTAIPLVEDGEVAGAVAITHDVTEEVDRARAGRSWTHELILAVNHELRSPLTTVLGHAELLEDETSDLPQSVVDSVLAIQRGSRALDHVVQQMSDLFGAGGADSGIEPRRLDLAEIVDALVRTARPRAARRRVTLDLSLPPGAAIVSADPERVRRALGAVLGDALAQSPTGSRVAVTLETEADRVLVAVSDEGPGIPEHERSGALWSFGATGTDATAGRRTGLVVANAVALAHGGRVTLADREPRGLRVVIDLPRVPSS